MYPWGEELSTRNIVLAVVVVVVVVHVLDICEFGPVHGLGRWRRRSAESEVVQEAYGEQNSREQGPVLAKGPSGIELQRAHNSFFTGHFMARPRSRIPPVVVAFAHDLRFGWMMWRLCIVCIVNLPVICEGIIIAFPDGPCTRIRVIASVALACST